MSKEQGIVIRVNGEVEPIGVDPKDVKIIELSEENMTYNADGSFKGFSTPYVMK